MKGLKDCYSKVILWLSSYLSVVAFVLTGGYVWLKSDNDNLKKETKKIFIVALVFLCIDAFLLIYHSFMTMGNAYSTGAYNFYKVLSKLVVVGKIITYAVFTIFALALDGKNPSTSCNSKKKTNSHKNQTSQNAKSKNTCKSNHKTKPTLKTKSKPGSNINANSK